MSYKKAEEVLPVEIIEMIQQYIEGENIYIPRKAHKRLEWGTNTDTRNEIRDRNDRIYREYNQGVTMQELSVRYFLSSKSIQRIIRMKR